jgi:hypothetical protein
MGRVRSLALAPFMLMLSCAHARPPAVPLPRAGAHRFKVAVVARVKLAVDGASQVDATLFATYDDVVDYEPDRKRGHGLLSVHEHFENLAVRIDGPGEPLLRKMWQPADLAFALAGDGTVFAAALSDEPSGMDGMLGHSLGRAGDPIARPRAEVHMGDSWLREKDLGFGRANIHLRYARTETCGGGEVCVVVEAHVSAEDGKPDAPHTSGTALFSVAPADWLPVHATGQQDWTYRGERQGAPYALESHVKFELLRAP